jgi:hypothetical protein
MTAIGKIFVIINLLFSLVVAGFIVVVYARSTNWKAASDKWEAYAKVADASRQASEGELQRAREDAARDKGLLEQEKVAHNNDREAAKVVAQNYEKTMEEFKKAGNKEGAGYQAVQNERDKLKDAVGALEKQVGDKDKQIVGLIETKNKANDERVASEIRATSYQGKAERMEARLKETETELVRLRRAGGGAGTGGASLVSAANPPPQNVEGVVTETTQRGDLIRISIGSDAGLARGHTLDVFRTNPSPQYLGQIRLTDVRASEAVGQPVDKLKAPVQKGDLVASDVMPKK